MSNDTPVLFYKAMGFTVQQPLRGYDLDADTLRRLYLKLSGALSEFADGVVSSLVKPDNISEEEWHEEKEKFRSRAFRVTVTIESDDGTNYFGDDVSFFSEQNLPKVVRTIYYTNIIAYKNFTGTDILDKFELFLDFTKPPLLDWSSLLSAPTPNNSNVSVISYNTMFKNHVISEVHNVMKTKRKIRSVFHQAFVYDALLFLAAVPYAFYATSKLSNNLWIQSQPLEWRVPVYVYAFMLVAIIYRLLFSYFKWAFPVNTFKNTDDASSKHRAFFVLIVLTLFGSAIYDLIKWLLTG